MAFIVIPGPLVTTLFERGAFDAADTTRTAQALAIYAIGLPAFVLQKVLQPLFYARENTRAPFRYALVSMVVNAAAAIGMAPFIGYIAAAWGTTLAAWAMVLLLWRGSRDMGTAAHIDARLSRRLPRIALSAALMGTLLWAAAQLAGPLLDARATRIPALAVLVLLGATSYFGAGFATRAFHKSDFTGALRRNR